MRTWRRQYEYRLGDLRQALDWCFAAGSEPALGVASAIRVWNEQSSVFEQMLQVERALEHAVVSPENATARARLANSLAWSRTLARQLGPGTDAAWTFAIELAEHCADSAARVWALDRSAHYRV